MARVVSLLSVVSLLAVAAPKKPPAPPPPAPTSPMPKLQEHFAEKVLATLTAATRVQPARVSSSGGLRPDPAKAIGTDFTRVVAGADLGAEQLKALRGVLYDEKSYRFEADVARCNFSPDASFRFELGLDVVEVLISFSCSQALFYVGKPGGRWLPSGTFDVRPARAKLLALVKEALSEDPVTQKRK